MRIISQDGKANVIYESVNFVIENYVDDKSCKEDGKFAIYANEKGNITYLLGKYSSEDKALKVMKMIMVDQFDFYHFHMPQDENVEV